LPNKTSTWRSHLYSVCSKRCAILLYVLLVSLVTTDLNTHNPRDSPMIHIPDASHTSPETPKPYGKCRQRCSHEHARPMCSSHKHDYTTIYRYDEQGDSHSDRISTNLVQLMLSGGAYIGRNLVVYIRDIVTSPISECSFIATICDALYLRHRAG